MKQHNIYLLLALGFFLVLSYSSGHTVYAATFGLTTAGTSTYPGAESEQVGSIELGSGGNNSIVVVDPDDTYAYTVSVGNINKFCNNRERSRFCFYPS